MGDFKQRFKNNRFILFFKEFFRSLKKRYGKQVRGRNNVIVNKGLRQNTRYDIKGNNNRVEIGAGTILSNMRIFMRGDNHTLIIGERCHLKGGDFYFEDDGCSVRIGNHTTVESAHFAVTEPGRSISIGSNCMFSSGIEFRTGDSHSILDKDTRKRINHGKDVVVQDAVWIGANAVVLKGVTVASNSIIGTGSLVTTDVPAHSIAAGIPAKVVRENVDWIKKRIYDEDLG